MNHQTTGFIADGLQRLLRSPGYQAKCAAIAEQVRADHAAELAIASDDTQRAAISNRIEQDIRRRMEKLTPSPYSLWSSK